MSFLLRPFPVAAPVVSASVFAVVQSLTGAGGAPANAIQQRDGAYIFDRDNSYIEVRA